MGKDHYQQKVVGVFINRLREELKISLPVETLLILKGMEGKTRTVALLKKRIKTLGELADMDYSELLSILGREKSEYLVMAMGLYNLRRRQRTNNGEDSGGDVATTEIVSSSH